MQPNAHLLTHLLAVIALDRLVHLQLSAINVGGLRVRLKHVVVVAQEVAEVLIGA